MKSLLLLAALLLSTPAWAEHAPDHKAAGDAALKAQAKAEIDSDGNGLVSKAEFMAHQEKRFNEADTDKDGNITDTEHKLSMDKWKTKRDEWRAKLKTVAPQAGTASAADKP